MRVGELLNEKEDLAAIHQSDKGIKEHLIAQLSDLERTSVEKGMQLLLKEKQTKELAEERDQYLADLTKAQKEVKEYKAQLHKEVKAIRGKMERMEEENEAYRKVLEEMSLFFSKVVTE
mmetsp:Transcript_32660/g.24120  ORF Transcript_32660/g.24120 Transcript_32660/m.24120 type:complete len:119 (-) Transcript_32660:2-358(-)